MESLMRKTLSSLLLALLLSPAAQAVQIDSVTTVSDEQGGTVIISTQGESYADAGSSQSQLLASSFSPRGEASTNAELTRSRSRGAAEMTTVYNGTATIESTSQTGEPISVEIELVNVSVNREGDGPEFSGAVIINGQSFDAAELPERARTVVGRLLRLFAFG
jgi:hypothetical protein